VAGRLEPGVGLAAFAASLERVAGDDSLSRGGDGCAGWTSNPLRHNRMGLIFLEPGSGPFRMNWVHSPLPVVGPRATSWEDVGVLKSYRIIGLAAVLAFVACGWSADAQQSPSSATYASATGQNDLITYCIPGEGGKPSALTVIDPAVRRIAVYHINRENGEIQLKSVRNITGDLGLDYWNSGSPLPQEITKMQQRQQ
jgi:hypothetical protein